jgi:hypothetical protein
MFGELWRKIQDYVIFYHQENQDQEAQSIHAKKVPDYKACESPKEIS